MLDGPQEAANKNEAEASDAEASDADTDTTLVLPGALNMDAQPAKRQKTDKARSWPRVQWPRVHVHDCAASMECTQATLNELGLLSDSDDEATLQLHLTSSRKPLPVPPVPKHRSHSQVGHYLAQCAAASVERQAARMHRAICMNDAGRLFTYVDFREEQLHPR